MAGIGNLTIDLIAQTASFNANITKAAGQLNSNAAKMNRSLQSIEKGFDRLKTGVATLGALAGGSALIAAGNRALDYAASLGEISSQIGVTIKDLQVYRYAATQVNLTQEEMEKGLQKLTASIGKAGLGSKTESDAFAALGISVRDASGHFKTASDIMPELADRLAAIPDPAARAAAEVALFGRTGQKLDPLLTQGSQGLQRMEDRAKSLGVVLDDDLSDAADKAADRMAELKMQLEANFARTVAENANSILVMANSLSSLAVSIANFWAQNPEQAYAIIGGLAGGRLGGLPGAAIGAVTGYTIGQQQKGAAANTNMDVAFRKAELQKALDNLKAARQGPDVKYQDKLGLMTVRSGDTMAEATARVNHQRHLLQQATAAALMPKGASGPQVPEFILPDFLDTSGGGKGAKSVDTFAAAMERLKQQTEDLRTEFQAIDESWSEADIAQAKIETEAFRVVQENSTKWAQWQKDAYLAGAKALVRQSDQAIWAKEKLEELSAIMEKVANNPIELNIDIAGQLERDTQRLFDQLPDLRSRMQRFWDDIKEMSPAAFDSITHGIEDVLLGFSSLGDAARSVIADLASQSLRQFVFNPLGKAIGIPGFGGKSDSGSESSSIALNSLATSANIASVALNRIGSGLSITDSSLMGLSTASTDSTKAFNEQVPVVGQFGGALGQAMAMLSGGGGGGGFLGTVLSLGKMVAGSVSFGSGLPTGLTSGMEAQLNANVGGIGSGGSVAGWGNGLFDKGGFTGPMGVDEIAGVVHGREYVFDAAATQRLGVANLEALRAGRVPGFKTGGFVGFQHAVKTLPAQNDRGRPRGGDIVVNVNGAMDERAARRTGMQVAAAARAEMARSAKLGY